MSFRFGSGNTIASVTPSDVEVWGTPVTAGLYTMHAVATDNNGVSVAQDFKLRVSEIGVDSASLPAMSYQHAYSATDRVVGGTAPYSVQVLTGSLPGGITATGNAQGIGLSGTPTEHGSFSAVLLVTDANSKTFQFTLGLTVSGAGGTTINISPGKHPRPIHAGQLQPAVYRDRRDVLHLESG